MGRSQVSFVFPETLIARELVLTGCIVADAGLIAVLLGLMLDSRSKGTLT